MANLTLSVHAKADDAQTACILSWTAFMLLVTQALTADQSSIHCITHCGIICSVTVTAVATCLNGGLQDALQNLNLVAEASMLDHCPSNAHMVLIGVNAVEFASWRQIPGNADCRVANIAAQLQCNLKGIKTNDTSFCQPIRLTTCAKHDHHDHKQ